jgi:regulator of sigma E protease
VLLLTIISFFVTLSLLVLVHEFGHFVVAKRSGIKVEEFGLGYPPRVLTLWKHGDTAYTINAIPFGGFVRMPGEDDPEVLGGFAAKPKRIRLAVLLAGPFMNFVLAVVIFAISMMIGLPQPSAETVSVVSVNKGSPAAAAGLQAGDRILAIDGHPIDLLSQFIQYTQDKKGQQVTLTVERNGKTFPVSLVPRLNPPEGQGAMGIALNGDPTAWTVTHLAPGQAFLRGVEQTTNVVLLTVSAPVLLLRGSISPEAARPVGPVGIARLTGAAAQQAVDQGWWFPILQLTGFISAALGITNLLPFPALDGGRIFFVVVEMIRGKRVDPRKEGAIHLVGLAILLTLMFLVTFQDIISPLPPIHWPGPS